MLNAISQLSQKELKLTGGSMRKGRDDGIEDYSTGGSENCPPLKLASTIGKLSVPFKRLECVLNLWIISAVSSFG